MQIVSFGFSNWRQLLWLTFCFPEHQATSLERFLLQKEKKCSHWEQFDPFRVDLFPKGVWRTGKQLGSHKSYLPCQKWRKYTIDVLLKFMYVIRCTHGALNFSMNKSLFYFALSTKCNKPHHYENTPILIILKSPPPKTENFQIKKLWYFSYFCSKHRLWVLVRTASVRRF